MKKILLAPFIILLLGVGCQKVEPPAPLPQPGAEETASPESQEMKEPRQEKIDASFDTNDYLDEALMELDEVE